MTMTTRHSNTFDTPLSTGQTVSRGKYTRCPICLNVKYKKQWHAADSKIAVLAHGRKAHCDMRRCPACEMKLEGLYNAMVVVHNVPNKLRGRVESMIAQTAKRAIAHNPQHRVLEVIETLDGYTVHTTTAKVARAISQQLQTHFTASEVTARLTHSQPAHPSSKMLLRIVDYL